MNETRCTLCGIIACDIPGFDVSGSALAYSNTINRGSRINIKGLIKCTATVITVALPAAVSCPAIYTQGHPEVCQGVLQIYSPRKQQMTATDQSQQGRKVTPRWYVAASEEPRYEK